MILRSQPRSAPGARTIIRPPPLLPRRPPLRPAEPRHDGHEAIDRGNGSTELSAPVPAESAGAGAETAKRANGGDGATPTSPDIEIRLESLESEVNRLKAEIAAATSTPKETPDSEPIAEITDRIRQSIAVPLEDRLAQTLERLSELRGNIDRLNEDVDRIKGGTIAAVAPTVAQPDRRTVADHPDAAADTPTVARPHQAPRPSFDEMAGDDPPPPMPNRPAHAPDAREEISAANERPTAPTSPAATAPEPEDEVLIDVAPAGDGEFDPAPSFEDLQDRPSTAPAAAPPSSGIVNQESDLRPTHQERIDRSQSKKKPVSSKLLALLGVAAIIIVAIVLAPMLLSNGPAPQPQPHPKTSESTPLPSPASQSARPPSEAPPPAPAPQTCKTQTVPLPAGVAITDSFLAVLADQYKTTPARIHELNRTMPDNSLQPGKPPATIQVESCP
jgi:hypothetical protein